MAAKKKTDVLEFIKVREVISPNRANALDAGIDFYVPTDITMDEFLQKNRNFDMYSIKCENERIVEIIIKPQQSVLIPSGIHVKIPTGNALIAFNKSGISTKTGADALACVVDETYQGEVHISFVNTSPTTIVLKAAAKIMQFVLLPVNYAQPKEVQKPLVDFYDTKTSRGDGGFGSTGK